MLMDGWLLKLVQIGGSVEDSIASWTLTKSLYSSDKKLQASSTNFWDGILSLDEDNKLLVNLWYFPSYSVLKCAMLSYGYLFETPGTKPSTSESATAEKCIPSSRLVRQNNSLLLSFPSLDRGLEGLLLVLGDCLNSLVSYFNTSEWESSFVVVTESITQSLRSSFSRGLR